MLLPAKARGERRLRGIKGGEAVKATQRRTKPRWKAAHQRRRALMEQSNVSAWMRVFMRLYRVGALGHNRAKGLVLVEPLGKQMHADKRQTGRHLDEMALRLRVFFERSLGAVSLSLD